jgi:hypothetical protein
MGFMKTIIKAALIGGLISGALDIAAASLVFQASPGRILQAVAAGLYGKATFTMRTTSMVAGALAQEFITVVAALLYCLAAQRATVLRRQWIICGLLYGAVCNIVVTFVIVPLSHAKPTVFGSHLFWVNLAINTALYGTPIAFAARRYLGTGK